MINLTCDIRKPCCNVDAFENADVDSVKLCVDFIPTPLH